MFRLARHCRQLLQVSCQSYTGQCRPEAGWAPQLEVHLGRDCVPVPLVQRGIWWEEAVIEKVNLIASMIPDFPLSPPSLTLSLCLCVIYSMCLCVPFETMKWYRFWASHRERESVYVFCMLVWMLAQHVCGCVNANLQNELESFHCWCIICNFTHTQAWDCNGPTCTHCLPVLAYHIRTISIIAGQLEIVTGWLACTASHL